MIQIWLTTLEASRQSLFQKKLKKPTQRNNVPNFPCQPILPTPGSLSLPIILTVASLTSL